MRRPSSIAYVCLLAACGAIALGTLNSRTAPLASNTMLLCLGVVAATIPLALTLAIVVRLAEFPGRRFTWVVLATLLFFPLYLQAAGWNAGFGPVGWQTKSLDAPWLTGWRGAIWVHTAAALPWATLIIAAGVRLTSETEAALLAASRWTVLWQLVIPSLGGPVLMASLWIVVSVAAEMTVADLFLIRTYAEELYTGFALGQSLSESLAMVAPSLLGLFGVASAAAMALHSQLEQWSSKRAQANDSPLFGKSVLGLLLVGGVLGLFYALPVASLVWQAGDRADGFSWVASLQQVASSFGTFRHELKWSFVIALLAATLALAVAAPLAWLGRDGGWRSAPAMATASLGLVAPGPLWAILAIWLLNRPGLDVLHTRTIASPVIVIAMRALPFAILVLWHAARTLPKAPVEAAQLAGIPSWRLVWHVFLPLRAKHWWVAWGGACAIAMGDLAASILVLPPAVETASVRLFGLLHAGIREQEAGLALASLICCGVVSAGAAWGLPRLTR